MMTFLGVVIALHPATRPARDNPATVSGLYVLVFVVCIVMVGWIMFR
jgi:hypothetical protein